MSQLADNTTMMNNILEAANSLSSNSLEDKYISGHIINIVECNNNRVDKIRNGAFYYCYSLTTVNFPACTTIGEKAFARCSKLASISFPACTSIGRDAFYDCENLTNVSFPACKTIDNYAFQYCRNLTSVSFPACTTIGTSAFDYCNDLASASFPACTTIGSWAFHNCPLTKLYLTGSSVVILENVNAFESTPISNNNGYVYVPSKLVESYRKAANWSTYSSIIVSL